MQDIVGRLAIEPTLAWIDCQSRKDFMSFPDFDPGRRHRRPCRGITEPKNVEVIMPDVADRNTTSDEVTKFKNPFARPECT
jgi:hypothetical protein